MEKDGADYQQQALFCYEEALKCLDKSIPEELSTESEEERKNIPVRILLGKTTVQLLLDDKKYHDQAIKDLESIIKDLNITSELNYRLLYNLASLYALADKHKIPIQNAKENAQRYLTYSLIRNLDHSQWNWANNDPDLSTICLDIDQLQLTLRAKLHQNPSLTKLTGKDFDTEVSDILNQVRSKTNASSS